MCHRSTMFVSMSMCVRVRRHIVLPIEQWIFFQQHHQLCTATHNHTTISKIEILSSSLCYSTKSIYTNSTDSERLLNILPGSLLSLWLIPFSVNHEIANFLFKKSLNPINYKIAAQSIEESFRIAKQIEYVWPKTFHAYNSIKCFGIMCPLAFLLPTA